MEILKFLEETAEKETEIHVFMTQPLSKQKNFETYGALKFKKERHVDFVPFSVSSRIAVR